MKSLSELDQDYRKLVKVATADQKRNYCTGLIRKIENYVTNQGHSLSASTKRKSFALIIAAEEEIKRLS